MNNAAGKGKIPISIYKEKVKNKQYNIVFAYVHYRTLPTLPTVQRKNEEEKNVFSLNNIEYRSCRNVTSAPLPVEMSPIKGPYADELT